MPLPRRRHWSGRALLSVAWVALLGSPAIGQVRIIPDTVWQQDSVRPRWQTIRKLEPTRRIGQTSEATAFGDIGDIAVNALGTVALRDREPSGKPILVFDKNGKTVGTLGSYGEGPGAFSPGSAIAILANGNIVVMDQTLRRLTSFDSTGLLIATISTRELKPYRFYADVSAGPELSIILSEKVPAPINGRYSSLWRPSKLRFHKFDLRTRTTETPDSESQAECCRRHR